MLLLAACRYALTGREVTAILMQRHVKVDGKVGPHRTLGNSAVAAPLWAVCALRLPALSAGSG